MLLWADKEKINGRYRTERKEEKEHEHVTGSEREENFLKLHTNHNIEISLIDQFKRNYHYPNKFRCYINLKINAMFFLISLPDHWLKLEIGERLYTKCVAVALWQHWSLPFSNDTFNIVLMRCFCFQLAREASGRRPQQNLKLYVFLHDSWHWSLETPQNLWVKFFF